MISEVLWTAYTVQGGLEQCLTKLAAVWTQCGASVSPGMQLRGETQTSAETNKFYCPLHLENRRKLNAIADKMINEPNFLHNITD